MSTTLKQIVAHAKEYGFIYPSSEIYDGLGAVYDYGPLGTDLKSNIREYWWRSMVQVHENIVGLDSAVFMHPKTWEASGHLEAFNDPLVDNKDSKKRYRADQLIETHIDKIKNKIGREIRKAERRFGDAFDEEKFRSEHHRVQRYQREIEEIQEQLTECIKNEDLEGLKNMIEELDITDPVSGSRNWTDVRQFNLMFSTQLGTIAGEDDELYLRPETAQGIFVNFLNVLHTTRQKVPFGIAQVGKAFRNEIIARQFIFRMREFEQMEMQFFVKPGEQDKWFDYWKARRMDWHRALGLPMEYFRIHEHEKLSHYAEAAIDIEFDFPFGFKELEGVHSRTDFDLSRHQEYSGKKLQYFDPEEEDHYIPYVVETSIGLDRMVLAVLSAALKEEVVPDDEGKDSERTVLSLPHFLAPVKCAVLPLVKNKEALTDKAREVFNQLKYSFTCQYDEKDSIGRRYRRQDAIGTPYCVTVDFESLEDNQVTLRDRDSLEQIRIPIEEVEERVSERIAMQSILQEIEKGKQPA